MISKMFHRVLVPGTISVLVISVIHMKILGSHLFMKKRQMQMIQVIT